MKKYFIFYYFIYHFHYFANTFFIVFLPKIFMTRVTLEYHFQKSPDVPSGYLLPPWRGETLLGGGGKEEKDPEGNALCQEGMRKGGKWRFVCLSFEGGEKWSALEATQIKECLMEQHRNRYRINYFGAKDLHFPSGRRTLWGPLVTRMQIGGSPVLGPRRWPLPWAPL